MENECDPTADKTIILFVHEHVVCPAATEPEGSMTSVRVAFIPLPTGIKKATSYPEMVLPGEK